MTEQESSERRNLMRDLMDDAEYVIRQRGLDPHNLANGPILAGLIISASIKDAENQLSYHAANIIFDLGEKLRQ